MRGLHTPNKAVLASKFCFNDRFTAIWMGLAIVAWMLFLPGIALAQEEASEVEAPPLDWTLEPVFPGSSDGEVIGLSGDITLSGFRPFAKLGYDLEHNALRYQGGVGWMGLSVAAYDWASATVLGRSGESGLMGMLDLGFGNASFRMAQPWLIDEEEISTDVHYFNMKSSHTFTGEFDFSLTLSSNFTVGMIVDQEGMFESNSFSVNGQWGELLFEFATGTSSNEAGLHAFEYTRQVHGFDDPLKGHSFSQLRLDRRVRLLTVPLDLETLFEDVPGAGMPNLTFKVEASGFGDVLHVQPNPSELDVNGDLIEPQNQIGWGVGLVLGLEEFPLEIRFDLFFNQLGEIKPLFG